MKDNKIFPAVGGVEDQGGFNCNIIFLVGKTHSSVTRLDAQSVVSGDSLIKLAN